MREEGGAVLGAGGCGGFSAGVALDAGGSVERVRCGSEVCGGGEGGEEEEEEEEKGRNGG